MMLPRSPPIPPTRMIGSCDEDFDKRGFETPKMIPK
jgi:hypothetical protein